MPVARGAPALSLRWCLPCSKAVFREVIDAVFPNPVDAFGGLISEVPAIKVPAEEEVELHLPSVGAAKLGHLHGLFFAALVGIGEITCRLRLEEHRETGLLRRSWVNNGVDGDINGLAAAFELHWYVQSEAECSRWHCVELDPVASREMFVAPSLKPRLDGRELPLFLGVADDGVGNRTAEPVRDDSGGSVNFGLGGRLVLAREPDEDVRIGHLLDDGGNPGEFLVGRCLGHSRRKFLLKLHALYECAGDASEADKAIDRERRAGRHA